MLNSIRVAMSALLVTACSTAACAAVKSSSAPDDTAHARFALVSSARAEIARTEAFTMSDSALLEKSQEALEASVEASSAARIRASALATTAGNLRGIAYELTNQPGLSAVQNRRMLAAMEAADAAENSAGAAQTTANLAAAEVVANRETIARLASQMDALQRRIDACTAVIRSQRFVS